MNPETDPLVCAWRETLEARREDAAILARDGKVLRTFQAIEDEAAEFAESASFASLPPGAVVAIQIGNHPAWPGLLLACLRRKLVALPLEATMSEHGRTAALDLCRAAALVTP